MDPASHPAQVRGDQKAHLGPQWCRQSRMAASGLPRTSGNRLGHEPIMTATQGTIKEAIHFSSAHLMGEINLFSAQSAETGSDHRMIFSTFSFDRLRKQYPPFFLKVSLVEIGILAPTIAAVSIGGGNF